MFEIKNPAELYSDLKALALARLVHIRYNDDKTLVMFKYTHEVFYKNLWDTAPALLEARGVVFTNPDTTGRCELAVLPLRKVFNLGENGVQLDMDRTYDVYEKINGFMAAVSVNPLTGKYLITTTGSFDSPFVHMAEEKLGIKNGDTPPDWMLEGVRMTYIHEIVHENDPHIVDESIGSHLLAAREMTGPNIGRLLNDIDRHVGEMTGRELLEAAEHLQREGFMIYADGFAAKLKTRYYRTKKFLMRVKGEKLRLIWSNLDKAKLAFSDEEFWPTFVKLREAMTADEFIALPEQERRSVLEKLT